MSSAPITDPTASAQTAADFDTELTHYAQQLRFPSSSVGRSIQTLSRTTRRATEVRIQRTESQLAWGPEFAMKRSLMTEWRRREEEEEEGYGRIW